MLFKRNKKTGKRRNLTSRRKEEIAIFGPLAAALFAFPLPGTELVGLPIAYMAYLTRRKLLITKLLRHEKNPEKIKKLKVEFNDLSQKELRFKLLIALKKELIHIKQEKKKIYTLIRNENDERKKDLLRKNLEKLNKRSKQVGQAIEKKEEERKREAVKAKARAESEAAKKSQKDAKEASKKAQEVARAEEKAAQKIAKADTNSKKGSDPNSFKMHQKPKEFFKKLFKKKF